MIAPLLGGVLSDQVSLRAPWLVGMFIGLLAVVGYATRHFRQRQISSLAVDQSSKEAAQ
jgi:hypothetical protein